MLEGRGYPKEEEGLKRRILFNVFMCTYISYTHTYMTWEISFQVLSKGVQETPPTLKEKKKMKAIAMILAYQKSEAVPYC